jgi:Tfp pilus assembly protein PilF
MERIEKLKAFLLESPADCFLQHALALEYVKLGNDAEARKWFEAILNSNPNYIGSYYHLGKLLERLNETAVAITWYEKGMAAARAANDLHALGELRGAYEELTF